MKNSIVKSFKELTSNRYLATLSVLMVLIAVSFIIYIVVTVRPSELQLVTHYTAFGVTNLYRDQWFYLLSFAGFAVISTFFHIALSLKIYGTKGSPLAIVFAWLGIGILVLAWVTAASIINVWSPI